MTFRLAALDGLRSSTGVNMPQDSTVKRWSKTIALPTRGDRIRISKTLWTLPPKKAKPQEYWDAFRQKKSASAGCISQPTSPSGGDHCPEPASGATATTEHVVPKSVDAVPKPKRKYAKRTPSAVIEPISLADRPFLTFKEAAAIYPASEQALRRLARSAEQYQKHPKAGLRSNGFDSCLVRHKGSRLVFLHAQKLADWWAASLRPSNTPPSKE